MSKKMINQGQGPTQNQGQGQILILAQNQHHIRKTLQRWAWKKER